MNLNLIHVCIVWQDCPHPLQAFQALKMAAIDDSLSSSGSIVSNSPEEPKTCLETQ
ncbi:uncharacterized protein FOMMEDRAFT_159077 [Fomitiporia mediterranea MF3/22]|uniref:uncharacterized protein n=1 Tax=Fomitiporia mediterranea (strain MF3/22) TaxID=694068 RepID=UPI00044078FC|nr:uncharacterized protein FOMMEDRAFT_159077 [Fomitiporia mediterranea MF3/22]EJD00397.1 hypothetical protein FOMMEDRAFT_159077 [Fomitiporia mediterranea MF3/22]